MARLSTAQPHDTSDGLTPFERAAQNKMLLGLFIPLQNGAWTPSLYPRSTDWTFEYNAECTVRAEEMGFDLVFGLAQWHGAGGLGGEMRFRENTQDPLLVTAGLAALTRNIMLISTVHVLYGWTPLLLAKYAATLDHMSNGRWGINMVTGIKQEDFEMFGLDPVEHDLRYEMADELLEVMKELWSSTENVDHEGRFYRMKKGFVSPKPVNGRPIIVNASSSGAGVDPAATHSDLLFITRPAGADVYGLLKTHNQSIKQRAADAGHTVRTIINPHIICADTEKEAKARKQAFIDEVTRYVEFYLDHMRLEESVILPEAERCLTDEDWHALNAAFATNQDPLNGRIPRDPQFDRLFTRIVMRAPAPVGLGQS